MKTYLSALLLFLAFPAHAGETFIGPTSPENRLLIADGELLIFSTISRCNSGCDGQFYFIKDGQTNNFHYSQLVRSTMYSLAGPGEITGEDQFIASFQRIENSGAKTVMVPQGATNTVEVAANSSIRFLTAPDGLINLTIRKNNQTISLQMFGGEELYGPLAVEFRNGSIVTYIITESPSTATPGAFAGHLNFTVEKSPDLKTWQPAFLFQSSEVSPQFFRLSVVK